MYDDLIKQFQDKLKFAPDFKKVVKFVEADVTLIATHDLFKGLMDGSKDPNMAFMMRKLKIKGSMGIAMRLNSILED